MSLYSRTLLETPRNIQKKKLSNGDFCYFGLKNVLKSILSQIPENFRNKLDISFNIDGLPLFNSSNLQFWPILGPVKNFRSNPFVIGIFCGRSKPQPLELFLEDFVDELLYLLQEDFEINNKRYHIAPQFCVRCTCQSIYKVYKTPHWLFMLRKMYDMRTVYTKSSCV